jgi:hypothetical protein
MASAEVRFDRMATTSANRALVIVALAFTVLLAVLSLSYGEPDLSVALYLAPTVLFALERYPLAFRLLAGSLGVAYGAWAIAALIVGYLGGVVLIVPALCLLASSLLPALAPGAAARQQRRMNYLSIMAVPVLALAIVLVVLELAR